MFGNFSIPDIILYITSEKRNKMNKVFPRLTKKTKNKVRKKAGKLQLKPQKGKEVEYHEHLYDNKLTT